MRAKRFHGLKRVKIRQDWNKYNLFNLTKLRSPIHPSQTYFQQKWAAKSQARAFHGETILEKHWKRMFNPNIRSVIPMKVAGLAQNDGSIHAAGRGAGLDRSAEIRSGEMPRLPYMNMTFAPTERRLDVAVWRAMFASSARQARQFVIHGYVKVNGQKMLYPAYQLNPGDMFQVDPDRVLFATGKPKKKVQARKSGGATESDLAEEEQAEEDAEGEGEAAEAESPETVAGEEIKDPKEVLTSLLYQAKDVLAGDTDASAKRKRALRAFQKTVRRTLSRKNSQTAAMEDLESQFAELTSKLNISVAEPASTNPEDKQTPSTETRTITSFQKKQIEQALAVMRENPVDPSKPYATPWMPRPFMSAFAFIPRYLEVQHSICSAVYLRHPVVRPGLAEVPTPFNSEVLGLAFNWYLKRR